MGDLSLADTVRVPIILCGVMVAIGIAMSLAAGVDASGLHWDYFIRGFMAPPLVVMLGMLVKVVGAARAGADKPLKMLLDWLPKRLELVILPWLIFPVFLAGFTAAKTSIHFLAGFTWDGFWTDADRAIFGLDPWILTHRLFGPLTTELLAWVYTVGWGVAFVFGASFVAIYGSRRFVATFFTAMMATWLVGGWFLALVFSSAGPVFAQLSDPSLGAQFESLRASLNLLLAPDNAILLTQAYLAGSVDQLTAVRGGGISAMPSMHLGACAIYICAARGTKWLIPSILFWTLIFVGSVHFGYHYALDGIIAAAIAALCWRAADRYYAHSASDARRADHTVTSLGPSPAMLSLSAAEQAPGVELAASQTLPPDPQP